MRTSIIVCIFYLLAFIVFTNCKKEEDVPINTNTNTNPCIKTNCSDYTSSSSAQAAFDSDTACHTDLDADNDGLACEEPGNSITICPTTSACGCSGKNKSPCELDPCCKWTTGSGCGCK